MFNFFELKVDNRQRDLFGPTAGIIAFLTNIVSMVQEIICTYQLSKEN